ncbi:MAG: 4-alpha-glucanotransferase, partial [Elusimicrobiaceae bacterium]|nr:4-alpha-glucanotransferase [Elusimicrobiaceae bacterium]
ANYYKSLGVSILQILPINEIAINETCPYTALSAFALDPIYISVGSVSEVQNNKKILEFIETLKPKIEALQKENKIDYTKVRNLKYRVLLKAFKNFILNEYDQKTPRSQEFSQFCKNNNYWLEGYAIFRALKELNNWSSWTKWAKEYQTFNTKKYTDFAKQRIKLIFFFKYLQWIAYSQFLDTKQKANESGVYIFGDIPFALNLDSADIWEHRHTFDISKEIGAPPDQFTKKGQRWGLPQYNWQYMEDNNFFWWRSRVKNISTIYDIFRLDHVIGFFRTWVYNNGKDDGHFDLKGEDKQNQRGAKFLSMVLENCDKSLAVAEDLGVIPDSVRTTLKNLQIPGYKIMRWEHDNGFYREPKNYHTISLASLSTHDTDTLKTWWETMPPKERKGIWEMISTEKTDGNIPFSKETHKKILARLLGSNSNITILSVQDIFGMEERINIPGTVNEHNWTFRFPYCSHNMSEDFVQKAEILKTLIKENNRI